MVGNTRWRPTWHFGWRPDRWTLLAAAIYFGSSIALTWPMPVHIDSLVYGQGGDAFGTIGLMEQLISSHLDPFVAGHLTGIGAPDGRPWDYPLCIATAAEFAPRWIASLIFGAVPAWNLYVLIGYLLTGTAMFLLVRRLTGNVLAALIAGWAYAFFPFEDVNGGAHVDFIQNWVLVVLVWRGLELRALPSRRNGLLLGASVGLALLWNPYFWPYAFVISATLFVADMVLSRREGTLMTHVRAWAVTAVIPVLILVALALVSRTYHVGAGAVPNEGIGNLYDYSARPLDYLIPIPGSGLLSGSNFASAYAQGYALGERGIYVGWSVLALAIMGFVVALRAGWVERRVRLSAITIAAIGLVAFAFSGIPTWKPFGVTIYTPTWFLFHLTSAWRDFARFIEVVELALCVLMGFGLAAMARNKRRWLALLMLTVVSVVMVKDLWWRSATPTIALPTNPIYPVLGRQHDNKVAAIYPLIFDEYPDYNYMFGSDVSRHPLLNGYLAYTPQETQALWLAALNNRQTPGLLARLDVGWVMINGVDPPVGATAPGKPGHGYRFVAEKGGWQLWRVVATPAFGQAYAFTGFQYPEEQGTAGFMAAWMAMDRGTVELAASHCAHGCDAILKMEISSYGQPRTMTLRYRGHVLARVLTPTSALKTFKVRLHLSGPDESLSVSQTPAPQTAYSSTGAVIGGPFGIEIGDPELLAARPQGRLK